MINNLHKFKLEDIKKNLFHRGFKIIKIKKKKIESANSKYTYNLSTKFFYNKFFFHFTKHFSLYI